MDFVVSTVNGQARETTLGYLIGSMTLLNLMPPCVVNAGKGG